MPGNELTVQDLLAALDRIRGWAAAVRSALEAGDAQAVVARVGDTDITNEHLIATQRITETWAESVRDALEQVENPESIVITERVDVLRELPRGPGCITLATNQCEIDIRKWIKVDLESS